MHMNHLIRKARPTDYHAILDIWEASVRATHHFLSEADIIYFRPLIRDEYLDLVDLFVITDPEETILGFTGIAANKIEMLFVDPQVMAKGLGKALLLFAVNEQHANSVDVNEQNERAVAFYKHMGFVITGRSEKDGLGKPYPLLHMSFGNQRKVILGLAVSLDGLIEGPNGEYDWCFTDQDYGLKDFFDRVDAVFIGRLTYDLVKSMPDAGGMPKLKQYVFSNTLESLDDESVLISGNIEAEVKNILRQPGKDIWLYGGASLTSALMQLGLVHELWLSVHPILLGKGKPLFQGLNERIKLDLLDSHTYETGLVSLRYAINR